MDYAGTTYDYQGVFGNQLIYSKIVPYVVKGAPLPTMDCAPYLAGQETPPVFCNFGSYTASTSSTHFGLANYFGRGNIGYHATDRSSAEEDAIKATSPPHTYGNSWPTYYMPIAKADMPINGTWYSGPITEGTSIYTQIFSGMTLAPDGYFPVIAFFNILPNFFILVLHIVFLNLIALVLITHCHVVIVFSLL